MDFDLNDAIVQLERTPGVLAALLETLPPAWASVTEGGDSWSPSDVMGHLVFG